MKRIVSVTALTLALILMLACFTACGGDSKKLTAGTYKLSEASGEGADVYEDLKENITLEVKDDGKATMYFMKDSVDELVFDEKTGKVTFEGTQIPYTVSGNKITIEDSTGKLVFTK